MKTPFISFSGALIVGVSFLLGHPARGGTVNIDFQPVALGVATETTRGLLGTGTVWNGVSGPVAGGPGGGGPGAGLLDDQGVATHVGVAALTPPAAYFFAPGVPPYAAAGANKVQEEGLVHTTAAPFSLPTGGPVTITIGFLRGGESYRIVFYNGAKGIVTQTVTANGVVGACTGRTDPPPALPGVAGVDHVVLDNVVASPVGDIVVTIVNSTVIDILPAGPGPEDIPVGAFGSCSGLQILGWFDGEPLENARRADSAVAKRSTSGFKGNDLYASRRTSGQTLTRRGNQARFFFRVENDGNSFADFSVRGTRTNGAARRRYKTLNPSANVTAAIRRGQFITMLESGESQIIRAVVRSRRERRNIDTHFQSTPAGLDGTDRATGRLRN